MGRRHGVIITAAILGASLLAGSASAQPLHARKGSVLIFPLFDSTEMSNTIISVTNCNDDERSCGNGLRAGDVQVHFAYFEGENCAESNTDEDLTPADTISVLARSHNPNFEVGYLIVEARDPETNLPIEYDWLIGSAIVVNSEFDFEWAYTPYVFDGLPNPIVTPIPDACGRFFLDTNADPADLARLDFDGMELSSFPERVYLDNFFGDGDVVLGGGGMVTFSGTLALFTNDPNNTDPNNLDVLMVGYNNNERTFSRTFHVGCYRVVGLSEISGALTQGDLDRGSDDGELAGIETGWFRLETINPRGSLLGVFAQSSAIGGATFVGGRELQFTGSRPVSFPRFF